MGFKKALSPIKGDAVISLPTIKEEAGDEDEIWTPEVEDALREALSLYPAGKRKIKLGDKIFGRNYLISLHIEKRCGKSRTTNQIASHLQVLMLRRKAKIEKIQKHLTANGLIAPGVFNNDLFGLTDSGAVKFLQLKEDQNSDQYFTDITTFLSNIFDVLPYRRIAGEKMAFLSVLIYMNEPNEYTDLIYSNTIVRGFTCVADSVIPEMKISDIAHNYGDDLTDLYKRGPKTAFYCVKNWNNLYYPNEKSPYKIVWDSIFYSKYLMDVTDTSTCYIMGQQLYAGKVNRMECDQIVLGSEQYYMYSTHCDKKFCIQDMYYKMMKPFHDSGDVESIRAVVRNQARLIVLTDTHTQEILLVLACINDYMPGFTGYQFYKLVDDEL